MSIQDFINQCYYLLRHQNWHLEGRRIRNEKFQCPIVALAAAKGLPHVSYVYARQALGLGLGDARELVSAADCVLLQDHSPIRQQLKAVLLVSSATQAPTVSA